MTGSLIRRAGSAIGTLAAVGLLGCSKGPELPDHAVPTHPVTGTLTYKGSPMGGAHVTFYSSGPAGRDKVNPSAIADGEGKYTLTTFVANDGAPVGQYTVTVYWPTEVKGKQPEVDPPLPPDRLKRVYADQKTSKLRSTVQNQNNVIDFTLP